MVFALGSLYFTAITSCVYTTGTGVMVYTFPATAVNNQELADKSHLIVFDSSDGKFWYDMSTVAARSTGTASITLPTGLTSTGLDCYLWFSSGSGEDLIISNSQYCVGEDA